MILGLKYLDKDLEKNLLLIGTAHVIFNDNRGDIKLAQMKVLTDAMALIKETFKGSGFNIISMITGDFNSAPCGGIYDFMRLGYYDTLKLARNQISGQYLGKFRQDEKVHSSAFVKSHQNLAKLPSFNDDA